MKVTSKGSYAILIMIEIALFNKKKYVSLRTLALNQNISIKFSEQIVRGLCKNGLLNSIRGIHGGYILTKDPANYTIGAILRTMGDSLVSGNEQDTSTYDNTKIDFFCGLNKVIDRYVDSVTLYDLVQLYKDQAANDYVI